MNEISVEKIIDRFCEQLSQSEEVPFTEIRVVKALPAMFADSSSLLWQVQCSDKTVKKSHLCFIKMANSSVKTPFWKMMSLLFGVDIDSNFKAAERIYPWLSEALKPAKLKVPNCLAHSQIDGSSLLLLSQLEGEAVQHDKLNSSMVEGVARYLSELHQYEYDHYGSMSALTLSQDKRPKKAKLIADWRRQLSITLEVLVKNRAREGNPPSDELIADLTNLNLQQLNVHRFVPLMMDLRWDQFATDNVGLAGVFDLDAFVIAPMELDFVILEYLLTTSELRTFQEVYEQRFAGQIPKLNHCRTAYRQLFYLVNSLGEENYTRWMAQPAYFD